MNLTAALLLGHLIADFPLQTNWIYQLKMKSWVGVLLHSLIHIIVTACLIQPISALIPLLLILGVIHFLTDFIKVCIPVKYQTPGFIIDQCIHIVVLLLLSWFWQNKLYSTLSMALLKPLLIYHSVLGLFVFVWVLSCDIAGSTQRTNSTVRWLRKHLLTLASYGGVPLFLFLLQQWMRFLNLLWMRTIQIRRTNNYSATR